MASSLPPPPIGEPPNSFAWQQWYIALQNIFSSTGGTIPWNLIDTSGSDLTDIVTRVHNTLQSLQGGTTGEFYHITSAQNTLVGTLAAGTYTPTLTNVTNLDASTAYQAQYIRVGATVTVSGKVDVDPTANTTNTELGISLPVASNFGADEDCAGVAHAQTADSGGGVSADTANDRAALKFVSVGTANYTLYFHFSYQVI